MQTIKRLIQDSRSHYILALLAGFGFFSCGVLMGHFLRLAACPLCILQRMMYLTLGMSATFGLLAWNYRFVRMFSTLLMLVSSGCGAFVAGYQTYIQRFSPDIQCSGQAKWWELLVDWAGERAPLLFQANGLCSDPAWVFLSLSMAEWSLILFIGLTMLSLYALFRSVQR